MNKFLPFVVRNGRFHMKDTRERINGFWKHFDKLQDKFKFDTILGLTGAKKFLSSDDAYGISGLGGACGNGTGYEFCISGKGMF